VTVASLTRRAIRVCAFVCAAFLSVPAIAADLGVASFTWTPEPVANGVEADFTLRVVNNSGGANNAPNTTITVDISDNFEVTTFPGACVLSGTGPTGTLGNQSANRTLTCNIGTLNAGADFILAYRGRALSTTLDASIASVAAPGNTDTNGGNDSLSRTPTVRSGADLGVVKSGPPTTTAGAVMTYTLNAENFGPNISSAIRVTDTLPADFQGLSTGDQPVASGTNWSCSVSSGIVTCNYTGTAIVGALPPITITGRIMRASTGNVLNAASIASTDGSILDQITPNNTSNFTTALTAGTDLRAIKSMTSTIIIGTSGSNITLGIQNYGPQTVDAGARIVDVLPANITAGTLPSGCSALGQTVTCIAATSIAAGTQADFIIPVNGVSITSGFISNSATVSAPAGFTESDATNNTATASFRVVQPEADLELTSKDKRAEPFVAVPGQPGVIPPVVAGGQIRNTIRVTNRGPSIASYSSGTPIIVTDQLGPDETYVSTPTAGWSCAPSGSPQLITCQTTGSGTLALNATLDLAIITQAANTFSQTPVNGAVTLSNTACTGSTASSLHSPADPATGPEANDCTGAGIQASLTSANVSLTKEVSRDGSTWSSVSTLGTGPVILDTDNSLFIRLVVSNSGPDTAEQVLVSDDLPNELSNGTFQTATPAVISGATPSWSPSTGLITWTIPTIASGGSTTLVVRIDRPFRSGDYVNSATAYSANTRETNFTDNEDSASYRVTNRSDISITAKRVSPPSVDVGVPFNFFVDVKNVGQNPATGVQVTDVIDLTRFDILAANTTKSGSSCSIVGANVTCAMGDFDSEQTETVTINVRAKYPFGGLTSFPQTYNNVANVTSVSPDSVGTNNSGNVDVEITRPRFDLLLTKNEAPSTPDPIRFGRKLEYDVRLAHSGGSRATVLQMVDTPVPPASPAGLTMTWDGSFTLNAPVASGGFTKVTRDATCAAGTGVTVVCTIGYLDPNEEVWFRLSFDMGGPAPDTTTTFTNQARITSVESRDTPTTELATANNVPNETTTVKPSTDLEVVSKTLVTPSPVNINQLVEYTIVVRNNGPSGTTQLRVTDTLPTGFVLATPVASATPAGAATVSSINCTGTTAPVCVLGGNFPGGAGNTVSITINVRAAFPYAGALDPTASVNTASIAPGQDGGGDPLSEDSVTTNNSQTASVLVQNASIAGRVFADNNRNNSIDAGEPLSGVELTITGTDVHGIALPGGITATTDGSGNYIFNNLPPSNATGYTITQTQPVNYTSWDQVTGTGTTTPGNASVANIISGIQLGSNQDGVAYNFREVRNAALSGYIYSDTDNDGTRDAGETGYAASGFPAPASPQVRLQGTDFIGNAVNLTATVDGSGFYSFPGLAPSDSSTGYTVTQLQQPTGTSDGLETNGIGAVVSGSRVTDVINVGVVNPADTLPERNFGELPTSSLAGVVYFDPNENAIKDGSENAGLAGATLTLTGTNDLGQSITCAIVTDATGAYSFPGGTGANCTVLRPGTYTVSLTPPPGLTHTGAFIGSAGGTAGAVTGVSTPVAGAANTVISAITIGAGINATNYNFGEAGQGLMGSVYIDANNNGVRDASEVGIPGVTIALNGTTATNQNVCAIITCSTTTDSSGNFSYMNLPGSNSTGYTLTEQVQSSVPLSNYVDGLEAVGGLSGASRGTAGNDIITGIVLGGGEMLTNYQFGEIASSLSGRVYIDNNDSGTFDGGEVGINGVLVTLSGTTASGVNVCTYLASLTPVRSCTTTTATDGTYAFTNLPAGTYTLTESQPSAYADGRETAGSSGGTPSDNILANIPLAAGTQSTNNLFGERAVSINGYVYKDPQRDGTDSGSEPRIGGVIIILRDNAGVEIGRTTTGSDGGFSFANLPAGTYTIEEVQPAGYGSSTANSVAVTVAAGGAEAVRFGETVSSIAGNVFVDGSNDGIRQTPAERAIPGVTITLTGIDAAGTSVTRSVTTATDGTYRFDDVLSGTYVLAETQPATYVDGLDGAGTAGGTVANDNISAIALPLATDATAYDFGERGQGLTGIVYDDRNRSGRSDAGDTPIAGVTIQLQDTSGTVIFTAITGADGRYSFPDVEAGNYVLVQIQPAGYGDAAENTSNRVPFAVVAGTVIPDINFGDRTGSVAGLVYNDSNGNGARDANEPIIPGVTITLAGTDARGNAITQTTTTDASGAYLFTGLPGGNYTVTETQPTGFNDAAETLGNLGGTIGADSFTLTLPAAQDATGYLFGERGDVGQINGTVWYDKNHNRVRDGNEEVKSGWTVQLFLGDTRIASATTDSNGRYSFTGINPGTGYRIRFLSPENIVFSGARTNEDNGAGNPGQATLSNGEITNLTLAPGGTVPNQSLPLDPAGIVYDSVRRVPVEGARVTFTGPAGYDPAVHLLGGVANATQTVGADGAYQFLLIPGAPSGVYSLSVTPPNGTYNPTQPSTILPPCVGALSVGSAPDPFLVSLINGAPPLGTPTTCVTNTATTAYHLSFNLTTSGAGRSANVINNNIPIDPILKGAIQVIKTTPLVNVTRGQLVPYTVVARNTLQGTLTGITITDRVPAGFQYKDGSARLNGTALEPVRQGRLLNWLNQTFTAREEKRYDLLLVVGSGVKEGEHTNEAYAVNAIVNTVVSDVATATVRLVPDPDFDCTDIIGKVFDDQNANGVQDENEPGLPGVRLATARGLLVTTDQFGRYHITCPMIANEERGSNFILKLDDRTLPTGYRITTMNPETVRLTRGKFAKLNFGASLHRIVRVDVNANAFAGNEVAESYRAQAKRLATILAERPSVLRIGYAQGSESDDVVKARLNALIQLIRDCWKEDGDRYRLMIEKETMRLESQAKGDVK
jgi:large repetitive protein